MSWTAESATTLLHSGLECAAAMLAARDQRSDLVDAAKSFRLCSIPRD